MRASDVATTLPRLPEQRVAQEEAPTAAARAQELMQGWPWFDHVPAEARTWLAARTGTRHYKKGQAVYMEGEAVTHIFGVDSGIFRIFISSSKGDEITLEEIVSGSWFPHFLPDATPKYAANCVCQEDATVMTVAQPAIAEFGQRWPGYFRGLYHEFGSRWTIVRGRIEMLTFHNLNVRLAVYLLRMLSLRGKPGHGGSILLEHFGSQSEIGARVGGTRQRVNAILQTWTSRGWIEPSKDGVRVLAIEKLVAEARKSGFDVDAYIASWHGGWEGKMPKLKL